MDLSNQIPVYCYIFAEIGFECVEKKEKKFSLFDKKQFKSEKKLAIISLLIYFYCKTWYILYETMRNSNSSTA